MLVNAQNLDAANTAFTTAFGDVFGLRVPGTWSQFTYKFAAEGKSMEMVAADINGTFREWGLESGGGPRQSKDLLAYAQNFKLRKWELTIEVDVDDVNGDRTGAVGSRLADFVSRGAVLYDQIVFDHLLTNPTCADGLSLLNNSHTNVNGGTYDNLTTDALSFASFRTGVEVMKDVSDAGGTPLGIKPSHLVVGPELERLAMEITGSDRPVGLSTAGAQDATSNVNAATRLTNYLGGSYGVIVSPHIQNSEWFLMALGHGNIKPMALAEFQAPRADQLTNPTDANVFYRDSFVYGISAKATPAGGAWQTIYGSVTA